METSTSTLQLALHRLRAHPHGPTQVEFAQQELSGVAMANPLIERFSAFYAAKQSKGFGRFDADDANFPLPALLRRHVLEQRLDFFSLSKELATLLISLLGDEALAEDQHLLVARVRHGETVDFLFLALIPEAHGISLSTEQGLCTSPYLDLDGIRLAARIDLRAWQQDADSRYVSFLKGRGGDAEFFKRLIACQDAAAPRKETQKLIDGIAQYADTEQLAPEARSQLFEDAHRYLETLSETDTPWHVEQVAQALSPDAPQGLSQALRHEDLDLQDGCIPDRRALRPLLRLKAAAPHWKLEFNRSGLRSGDVLYDSGQDRIVLSNLPEDLRRALQLELR
ncbi:MAG: nucleoid-associated protein [Uliginosibacterium sp.]|jgi:nucleoid-associated protein|nr:nucleoid-associated protein [Uliginosibacterium sp.]